MGRNNNLKGRPIKRENPIYHTTSFFIPESFQDVWKKITTIANESTDEEFLEYCKDSEGFDSQEFKKGKRGAYIRWILSKHVMEKL